MSALVKRDLDVNMGGFSTNGRIFFIA